jgi:tight adherence protein C
MSLGLSLILWGLLFIGAGAVLVAVLNLFAPKQEDEHIVDVAARKFKSSSSFSRLQPETKWMDRLAVFCLNTFQLEKPLEELHMQLGSPDYPQPVNILYWKVIWAIGLPVAIIIMFQTIWGILFVPLGFYLPDIMLKSKIQKRQAEILGNFSTTVDLAALIIESGLDYLTAFERIISIAKKENRFGRRIRKNIKRNQTGLFPP